MTVFIKNVFALAPGLETPALWREWAKQPQFEHSEVSVPKLEFVPAMQRRRLSPYARMCCHTLHQLTERNDIEVVFATRCGDLVKTDQLIEDAVSATPLSPAQFGLSVHNAVAGQYSIFTNNKHPSTTISAGQDTFHLAIIDAKARLSQSEDDEIAVVCTDSIPPEKYLPFMGEQQINHSVALLLSKTEGRQVELSQIPNSAQPDSQTALPQALQFLAWYYSNAEQVEIASDRQCWRWQNG